MTPADFPARVEEIAAIIQVPNNISPPWLRDQVIRAIWQAIEEYVWMEPSEEMVNKAYSAVVCEAAKMWPSISREGGCDTTDAISTKLMIDEVVRVARLPRHAIRLVIKAAKEGK